MIMVRALLIGGALAITATVAQAEPEHDLGASVRANAAAQIVDAAPDYSSSPVARTSGRRAADAMIRYQTGRLKPLFKTNGKTELGAQGGASDAPTVSIPLISTGAPN